MSEEINLKALKKKISHLENEIRIARHDLSTANREYRTLERRALKVVEEFGSYRSSYRSIEELEKVLKLINYLKEGNNVIDAELKKHREIDPECACGFCIQEYLM